MAKEASAGDFVRWFSELSAKSIEIAGGKGANLAEMYNNKFPIPPGFIVTTTSYKYFIEKNGLQRHIDEILNETDVNDVAELERNSAKIRSLIENANMPPEIRCAVLEAYDTLDINKKNYSGASKSALDILKTSQDKVFVAVRSSATTEDLGSASFAGQQETFLNVKGDDNLINSVKKCFASLFTARAIYYRKKRGFEHKSSYLSVVVQKMVDADKSGVIFSKNPVKSDRTILIEAVYGLGEGIVSGKISPDSYSIDEGLNLVEHKIGNKKIAFIRNSAGETVIVKLNDEKSSRAVLTGHELRILAQYAIRLEEHYGKPQDIEFSIENGEIYIVQTRPITTEVSKKESNISGNVLLAGLGASQGIASGTVRIIHEMDDLKKIKAGDVLVTKMTSPDMVVSMQKAVAIVTDEGGVTSHAAIVSREMGIPAVVGTQHATEKLKDGEVITVDGYTGRIIEGKGEEKKIEIKKAVSTKRTKIKLILDLPEYAQHAAQSGIKEIGLVRLEGIVASSARHPAWYVKKDKIDEYIGILCAGLKKMAKYFDSMWIRTTDIRSDEYKNLEGAPDKIEANPMMGNHGIRFSLRNIDLLEAEFRAIKELADEYNNKNFGVMVPQLISLKELKETKKIASKIHFPENVKIGIMVETPAAVQIINELCEEGIDFISFGTNDLTQFTLAVDRNNEDVQDLYDEMHPAVLSSLKQVIKVCRLYGIETSICGQAGSKPEIAKFLVEQGINSISVNADAAYDISKLVAEMESIVLTSLTEDEKQVSKEIVGNRKEEQAKEIDESKFFVKVRPEHYRREGEEKTSDEQIILRALNDGSETENSEIPADYSQEVPPLNEAIPISSDDFQQQEQQTVVDLQTLASANVPFEKQEERVFDAVVMEEVKKSEVREEIKREFLGQEKGSEKEKKTNNAQDFLDDVN